VTLFRLATLAPGRASPFCKRSPQIVLRRLAHGAIESLRPISRTRPPGGNRARAPRGSAACCARERGRSRMRPSGDGRRMCGLKSCSAPRALSLRPADVCSGAAGLPSGACARAQPAALRQRDQEGEVSSGREFHFTACEGSRCRHSARRQVAAIQSTAREWQVRRHSRQPGRGSLNGRSWQ